MCNVYNNNYNYWYFHCVDQSMLIVRVVYIANCTLYNVYCILYAVFCEFRTKCHRMYKGNRLRK